MRSAVHCHPVAWLLAGCLSLAACATPDPGREPQERRFAFRYEATVTGLAPGQRARVWLPLAQDGPHQEVRVLDTQVRGDARTTTERRYGNRLLHADARADPDGRITLAVDYEVTRREVLPRVGEDLSSDQRKLFLSANAMVPLDDPEVEALVGDTDTSGPPDQVAGRLYDLVWNELRYDKPEGSGWGRGDARWACSAKHGNCTDFHSLFIAMCRDAEIPARFEMGFPLPPDQSEGTIGGYHCWAWFADGGRWIGCDISEADKHPELKDYYFGHLSENRVAFTVGRDLVLEPPQAGPPVNYLVYPYVEVDDAPWIEVETTFSFRNL
jgi:transglutaminase-like putative cysteine protease